MITLKRFARIEKAIRDAGFADIIEWSQTIPPPENAHDFASDVIYVICNSGMRQPVAKDIHERCMVALSNGLSAATAFGHPGKQQAIDVIWEARAELFAAYVDAPDKIAFCETLPWIGPVTKYHLAKNFGIDTAKPDVHLERLASREGSDTFQLCGRLARLSGYRIATVDSILWRACAEGIINSRVYEAEGWRAAFNGVPTYIPEDQEASGDELA
jgi:hypothetical protein